tara:strand:+ start:83 stop:394 length:312 start_codon:yes stop_codon:yes gene_type:complete
VQAAVAQKCVVVAAAYQEIPDHILKEQSLWHQVTSYTDVQDLLAVTQIHYVLEDAQNLQQFAGLVLQQTGVCVLEAAKAVLVFVQQTHQCIVVSLQMGFAEQM